MRVFYIDYVITSRNSRSFFIKFQFASGKSARPIDIIVNAVQEKGTVQQSIRFQFHWSVEDEDKADDKQLMKAVQT